MYSDDRSFVELFVDVMYDPIALDCSVILSSDEAASRLIVDAFCIGIVTGYPGVLGVSDLIELFPRIF